MNGAGLAGLSPRWAEQRQERREGVIAVIGRWRSSARVGRLPRLVPVLLAALALVMGVAACASGPTTAGSGPVPAGPRLSFQERAHDVGQISASQKTEYRFPFTNTGSRPLEIGDIRLAPASPGG